MKRSCVVCGNPLRHRQSLKYCSRECYRSTRMTPEETRAARCASTSRYRATEHGKRYHAHYNSRSDVKRRHLAHTRAWRARQTPERLAELYRKGTAAKVALRRERVEQGLCYLCGSPADAGKLCFEHWMRALGRTHKLNVANGGVALMKRIWSDQGGVCALTGEKLRPGDNASLDHIVAKAKGGETVRSNLRWVSYDSNMAKRDLSDAEFVALCRKVVKHADRTLENVLPIKRVLP